MALAKATEPIEVTLLGITKDVRATAPENASTPIDVTLFGIVRDVRERKF